MWEEVSKLGDCELLLDEEDFFILKNKGKEKNILKEEEEENSLPHIPQNIIIDILVRVPATDLHANFQYICKSWHDIISRSDFIEQNAIHNKSKLLVEVPTTRKCQYYKAKMLEMDEKELALKLNDFGMCRMGQVRSSCNGLLLVNDPKQKGLLHVMNLLTNCVVTLPRCPSGCPHRACGSALGFNPDTKEYKVVHIYSDVFGYEIFTLGCSSNEWRRIAGPFKELYEQPFGLDFYWGDPVLINEQVMHWYVSSQKYIISMDVSDENSRKTYLPDCGQDIDEKNYALLEMGGFLSFVYNVSDAQIDVWILKDFHGQVWFKTHSVSTELINYTALKDSLYMNALPDLNKLLAIATLRNGEIILFKHRRSGTACCLYLYEIKHREMRKFKMVIKDGHHFIPHRSTLLSWKTENKPLP